MKNFFAEAKVTDEMLGAAFKIWSQRHGMQYGGSDTYLIVTLYNEMKKADPEFMERK